MWSDSEQCSEVLPGLNITKWVLFTLRQSLFVFSHWVILGISLLMSEIMESGSGPLRRLVSSAYKTKESLEGDLGRS